MSRTSSPALRTVRPPWSVTAAVLVAVLWLAAPYARANFELIPRPSEPAAPTTRPGGAKPPADAAGGASGTATSTTAGTSVGATAGASTGTSGAGRPASGAATRPTSAGTSSGPVTQRPGKSSAGCSLSEQTLGASELRADGSCR